MALAILVMAAPGAQAADRPFEERFSTNDTGNIVIAANSLTTCGTSTTCQNGQSQSYTASSSSSYDNGTQTMSFVDTDGDPATSNSSTSTLSIPAGSTVLFAGLYWSGQSTSQNRRNIDFKVPGGSYTTLQSDVLDVSNSNNIYQGFKDVTSLVAAAGAGTYSVGDITSDMGNPDKHAGWSLVVAYHNPSEPARNLTVFDGLVTVQSGQNGTIAVDGFLTPPTGPVTTDIGFVTYEGDRNITGDGATFRSDGNSTALSNPANPQNNFFNSSISRNGANVTTRDPAFTNTMGFDADVFRLPAGALGNSATSAEIDLTTTGDRYVAGVVTFATEIFVPRVTQTKPVQNLTRGGPAQIGDILRYTITGRNDGQDGATNFVVTDTLPANTEYVSSSTAAPGNVSYNAGTNTVTAYLGTGATASSGGTIAPGGTYTVTIDVRVTGPLAAGTVINNSATANFTAQTLGTPGTVTSNSPSVATVAPDLTITKSHTPAGDITAGTNVSYLLTVSNVGQAPSNGTVTVTDTLPPGMTFVSSSGPGWTCTGLTCTRSDAVNPNQTFPTITVVAHANSNIPAGTLTNAVTVAGGGDANTTNNSAQDSAAVNHRTDLSITKSVDDPVTIVGDVVVYTIVATNDGPSDATGVQVGDILPAGMQLDSTPTTSPAGIPCPPSGGGSAFTCMIGSLAAGDSVTITVRARVFPPAAGQTLTNVATVSGAQTDPTPGNNSDDADVTVGGTDLEIEKVSTSPAEANQPTSWRITVINNGPSPATGVTFTDTLGPGLSNPTFAYPDGIGSCTPAGVCSIGSLAVGQQVRIDVTADVAGDIALATNTATVTGNEPDPKPEDNRTTVTTPVIPSADVSIEKTASSLAVDPGDEFFYTLQVTNAGPSTAQNVVISDPIPAGLEYVSSSAGCTYDAGTSTVTCPIGSLAENGSATRQVTVRVAAGTTGSVRNTATVTSTTPDPDPNDNEDDADITVPATADGQLTKTASPSTAAPGQTVTYTLTYRNNGPGTARNVVLSDTLPGGVTLTSADAPCTTAGNAVTCPLGDVPAGETRSVQIRATVDPVATTPVEDHVHELTVGKNETFIGLGPGQQGTFTVDCGPGKIATDASVRTDDVWDANGQRQYASLDTVELVQINGGSGYRATVRNLEGGSTGQLQGHLFVVCLDQTLAAAGNPSHTHDLTVSAPVSASAAVLPPDSRTDLTVTCGPGQTPVSPEYTFTGGTVRVAGSELVGNNTWRFTLETEDEAATADVSVRCLDTLTTEAGGHVHEIDVEHRVVTVTVPPGSSYVTPRVTCDDLSKGIMASWDLPEGLLSLGNDPQPKIREFRILNTTNAPLEATIDLTCINVKTSGPTTADRITNTASASSTTPDSDSANNSASATVTIGLAPAPGGGGGGGGNPIAPGPAPKVAPAPVTGPAGAAGAGAAKAAAAVALVSKSVTLTSKSTAVDLKVSCAADCAGTAKLKLAKALKVGSKRFAAGRVIGSARYTLKAGRKATLKVKVAKQVLRALRSSGARNLKITLTPSGAGAKATTVVLSLRAR